MAKRQNTTVEEIKRFFGEDLKLLERDVRENKIREWACPPVPLIPNTMPFTCTNTKE